MRVDLADSTSVRTKNTIKTFHIFELQNHQTPLVRLGLANHHNNNRTQLSH